MTIHVVSDTHFNHANIIRFCDRPFASLAEMNEEMIDAWNNAVMPKDQVWVGGDFAYNAKDEGSISVGKLFMALNGKKHLVRGNHDEQNRSVLELPWTTITDLASVKIEGMRFVMCHYPLETWKAPSKFIHLHGHCHGNLKRQISRRFDVGVDVGHPREADFLLADGGATLVDTIITHEKTYAPVPLEVYWQIGSDQKFQAQDHS